MKMQEVLLHLLLKQPFYGYIASSVTPVESTDTATLSVMAAPYITLQYNREWFEALKEEHAIGAVIHELLHLILLHPYRKGNRERHLWIIACDMAVNEHVDPALLPREAITVEKLEKEFKERIPRLKSAEFYYDILAKGDDPVSFSEKDKEITVVLKNGQELKANDSMEGDSSEINKNALKSMLAELVEHAKEEGEIPGVVCGFIDEIYSAHEVNWRNLLKRFLSGKGKVLKTKTFKRESKRFENLPGNKRTVGTTALLALDESGSVSEKQLAKFYNELRAIKKITGAEIHVTEFDTECTEPVPMERYVRKRLRVKNGGTDFHPVFELADKMKIPLLIVFTDGEGPAPEVSNQKVLWILTKNGKKPVDYGYSITIDA